MIFVIVPFRYPSWASGTGEGEFRDSFPASGLFFVFMRVFTVVHEGGRANVHGRQHDVRQADPATFGHVPDVRHLRRSEGEGGRTYHA